MNKCYHRNCSKEGKIRINGRWFCYEHNPNYVSMIGKFCEYVSKGQHRDDTCDEQAFVKVGDKYYCEIHDPRRLELIDDEEKEEQKKREQQEINFVLNHPLYKEIEKKLQEAKK